MGICCICNKKYSTILDEYYPLDDNHVLCGHCSSLFRNVLNANSIEEYYELRDVFWKHIGNYDVNGETLTLIINKYAVKEKLLDKQEIEEKAREEYLLKKKNFLLTTGYNFEKHEITQYLNIVHGEVVLGTGFLSELSASINDFWGKNSTLFEGKLSLAKQKAQEQMIIKALSLGANALIGIDFDITTFTNNIIGVSVTGTAVIIEKII